MRHFTVYYWNATIQLCYSSRVCLVLLSCLHVGCERSSFLSIPRMMHALLKTLGCGVEGFEKTRVCFVTLEAFDFLCSRGEHFNENLMNR